MNLVPSPVSGFDQVRGGAPQTIARTFRFSTIAVENPQIECVPCLLPEDHAIGANAKVAIADGLRKIGETRGRDRGLPHEEEVVAECLSFYKINHDFSM